MHDDRGAAAGLEQAEKEGEEEQFCLLRLHLLEQDLGRRIVVEAAGEGRVREDERVRALFGCGSLRERVAIADVRCLDTVEQHVHAADAEHGVVEVVHVEYRVVEGIIGANRFQRLSVNRGFFRMIGLVATGMLLALTLIGHNLVSLHSWHTRRGLPSRGRHTGANPSTTGPWRKRPAPAAGASATPTHSPGPSHSPRTTLASACPKAARTP